MLVIVLLISIIFPLFFAYIDRDLRWSRLLNEWWLTGIRLLAIVFITDMVMLLGRSVATTYPNHWLRHTLQVAVILPLVLVWLLISLQYIEFPATCPNCFINYHTWEFRRFIGLYFIISLFIYAFMSGLDFYKQAQEKAAEAERLQKEFAQVRLQALKHQVNPHFLFNSLSVLSTLVQQDPMLSEKFIHQLSKAYRYILDQKDLLRVTLSEELEFLEAYFFLLQIRFGNKVQLQQKIDPSMKSLFIPPLTLQLLVENAVKHNRMSNAAPLVITVYTTTNALQVCNNFNPREVAESSTGIGLENIQKRISFITADKLVMEQTTEEFCITVPLVKE